MARFTAVLAVLPAVAVLGATGPPLGAQDVIRTADVHLLAQTIQADIDLLRWHMGRPPEVRPPIPVEAVDIRENFGQAMTLWRKVNQLGVELVGGGESPPVVTAPRDGNYGPEHVHQVLTSVGERLQEIIEATGVVGAAPITAATAEPQLDPTADPSDVFQLVVQANRQVNRMLERQAQPGDVYQRVQQAVFYAAEILAALGDDEPMPALPAYEAGLRPAHVYGRLLEVFDRLSVAFEGLGLNMVRWSGGAYTVDPSLGPGDVFDLATLLTSELEYLHALIPAARVPLQVEHPGRRWPSDVNRQAGVLNEQMSRLVAHVRANPTLLASGPP